MRRRLVVLLVTIGLMGAVVLAGCGSDVKEAPTRSTTSTTVEVTTTTVVATTTEQPIPEPSRDGGSGRDNGNSGEGNVGGASNGPRPGANNSGG